MALAGRRHGSRNKVVIAATGKSVTVALLLGEHGRSGRGRCVLRECTRVAAFQCGSISSGTSTFPESVRPEKLGAVKVHRKNVENPSNQKEETGDEWERVHEVAHHLGSEQKL